MPIKNYSTSVGFHRTIAEIEKILGQYNCTHISKVLGDGDPVALYFTIPFKGTPINYKMPTRWKRVHKILQNTSQCSKAQKSERHAKNVAWRNVKDWIDAQTALMETEMVELEEIFLPFMVDRDDQTVYDKFLEQGPKLLEGKS